MTVQTLLTRRDMPQGLPWDKLDLIIRREVMLYTYIRWPRHRLIQVNFSTGRKRTRSVESVKAKLLSSGRVHIGTQISEHVQVKHGN